MSARGHFKDKQLFNRRQNSGSNSNIYSHRYLSISGWLAGHLSIYLSHVGLSSLSVRLLCEVCNVLPCYVIQTMRGSRKFCQRGSIKYHLKEAIIGPPAKHHSYCVALAVLLWSNIECCLGSVIFQGIRTSIEKNPYRFVIFHGGPDPLPLPHPSGSAHINNLKNGSNDIENQELSEWM